MSRTCSEKTRKSIGTSECNLKSSRGNRMNWNPCSYWRVNYHHRCILTFRAKSCESWKDNLIQDDNPIYLPDHICLSRSDRKIQGALSLRVILSRFSASYQVVTWTSTFESKCLGLAGISAIDPHTHAIVQERFSRFLSTCQARFWNPETDLALVFSSCPNWSLKLHSLMILKFLRAHRACAGKSWITSINVLVAVGMTQCCLFLG